MRVDIIIDTICPWCYLGQARFAQALAARPALKPGLHWRPFQLNPNMPAAGRDRESYLLARFGGAERARSYFESLKRAGRSEGLEFDFDRIERTPNTVQSHRLIAYAGRFDLGESAVNGLFRAYFAQGLDLGSTEVLVGIGSGIGLEPAGLAAFLDGDEDRAKIRAEDDQARNLGVNGIPCYVIDGRYAISGAQSPEVFLQILDLARQDGMLQAAE